MLDGVDTIVVEDSAVRTLTVADHEVLVEIELDGASDPVCKYTGLVILILPSSVSAEVSCIIPA